MHKQHKWNCDRMKRERVTLVALEDSSDFLRLESWAHGNEYHSRIIHMHAAGNQGYSWELPTDVVRSWLPVRSGQRFSRRALKAAHRSRMSALRELSPHRRLMTTYSDSAEYREWDNYPVGVC